MLHTIKSSLIGYENALSVICLILSLIALAFVAKHKYLHSKNKEMTHKLPGLFWFFMLLSNYILLLRMWVTSGAGG